MKEIIAETVNYFIILATHFELLEIEKIFADICYKNKHDIREKLQSESPTIFHAYGSIDEYFSLNINKK